MTLLCAFLSKEKTSNNFLSDLDFFAPLSHILLVENALFSSNSILSLLMSDFFFPMRVRREAGQTWAGSQRLGGQEEGLYSQQLGGDKARGCV